MKRMFESTIKDLMNGDMSRNALVFFPTPGYNNSRQNPFMQKTYQTFKKSFIDDSTRFNEENVQVKQWQSVDLLFQLSKDEMR